MFDNQSLRVLFGIRRIQEIKMSKSNSNPSDTDLKEQGNKLFSMRKYDDAITCYSKAIVSSFSNAHFVNLFSISYTVSFFLSSTKSFYRIENVCYFLFEEKNNVFKNKSFLLYTFESYSSSSCLRTSHQQSGEMKICQISIVHIRYLQFFFLFEDAHSFSRSKIRPLLRTLQTERCAI